MYSLLYDEKRVAKHLPIFPYISIPKNQEYGVIPGQVLSVTSVCNPKLYSPCDYRHSVVHCHIIWGGRGGNDIKGSIAVFFPNVPGSFDIP